MTEEFVKRLSSPILIASLMRLTLHEGASCGSMEPSNPGRITRIVMLREELQHRLRLLDDLGRQAQHVAAHLEVLVLEHPEFAERDWAKHCAPRLKGLASEVAI